MPRIDYGATLASPGALQPNTTVNIDAYGLVQAQATFALDSSDANIQAAIATYSTGVDYPHSLGFLLKSYKYHVATSKGGVAMMTVDYIGVSKTNGYTDAQITGVSNTMAQPIETHPNFQIKASGFADGPLAGTNSAPKNGAIFLPQPLQPGATKIQYAFGGFALSDAPPQNKKAGIRQYLRPMINIRGQIIFGFTSVNNAYALANSTGMTVGSASDLTKLIAPVNPGGTEPWKKAFINSVNLESIGANDSGKHVVKATYDIMIANDDLGWDPDVYKASAGIFG